MIRRLAEKLWSASRKEPRIARTFVLKLKTILPPARRRAWRTTPGVDLELNPEQRYRLVGVG
jgi:hypothetical protein